MQYAHDLASGSVAFGDGFRQVIHVGRFHCVLISEVMTVYPEGDFETVDEVQEALLPYLRGWEIRSELLCNRPFRFIKTTHLVRDLDSFAQIVGVGAAVEKEQAQPIKAVVHIDRVALTDRVTARVDRTARPEIRPIQFSKPVEDARARWHEFSDNRERLLVSVNWILSHLETYFGGRREAANGLNAAFRVLRTIGELAAINDPNEGRKRSQGDLRRLTDAERNWLTSTIPRLIYRFAEVESGYESLSPITMQDLPPLEP